MTQLDIFLNIYTIEMFLEITAIIIFKYYFYS